MSSTTKKFADLIGAPLAGKSVDAIPGIGDVSRGKFKSVNLTLEKFELTNATQLFGLYLLFCTQNNSSQNLNYEQDFLKFFHDNGIRPNHAKVALDFLKQYAQQHV